MCRIGTFALIFAVSTVAWAESPGILWEYRLNAGHFDCSPAVGDLLLDGRPELVVASTAGHVLAVDATGRRIWQSPELGDFVTVAPTLADVTGDGALEVLAVTNGGRLVCLDGRRGAIIWEHHLGAELKWAGTSIVAADLEGDGRLNLVLGDMSGTLTCLNADGRVLWRHNEAAPFVTSPAVGDMNGDGQLEVLAGTRDTPLLCVTAAGRVMWRLPDTGAAETSPVVWDLTEDGQYEVLTGIGNALAAVNAYGDVLWMRPMRGAIDSAIAVADLTGDGAPEVVAVDLTGHVVCTDAGGAELWTGSVEQRARRSPVIADVTGDGALDVLIGGYSGAIHVFSSGGELLERIDVGAHMNASPAAVDLDGSGRLSVAAALNSAFLRIYQWDAPEGPKRAPWPEYRLNSRRTASEHDLADAAAASLARVSFGGQYAGENFFEAEAVNPDGARVALRLEIEGLPGGPLVVQETSTGEQVAARLRYVLDGLHAHNLTFSAILEHDARIIARKHHSVHAAPFEREWADLTRDLDTIAQRASSLSDAQCVEERVLLLRHRAAPLRAQVEQATAMPLAEQRELRDRLHALIAECRTWTALTAAATQAGAPLVVHAANPWAPFGGTDEIVEGRHGPAALSIEGFNGSVESAALNIFNFASKGQTLRVELDDFSLEGDPAHTVPARAAITLHEVLDVPTQMLDMSPDALPRLNQAQTIAVPAWEGRQLWLRVDTRAMPRAGRWQSKVTFHPLAPGAEPVSTPLTLTVWEAAVPEEQALELCTWAYVHRSAFADQPEAALEDQLAHGSSVFVSPFPPRAQFDSSGAIVSMDFTAHDAHVDEYGPHGILLMSGYTGALDGPAAMYSEVWRTAHVAYLRRWIAHLAERGYDYDNYALYPRDEPGLTEGSVDYFMTFAELAKEADPRVRVYANPVAGATMEDLRRMTPYVDIWAPHRYAYMIGVGGEKLEYIKSLGKTLWTYECEANVKHQSPLGYYRAYAWNAWRHGMTGFGFWTYCTSGDDPWHEPAPGGQDYLLVYPGEGVVTSKRWEAVRDAITDYTMLDALRTAAEEAAARGAHAEAIADARVLLDARAQEIAEYNSGWSDSHGPGASGAPRERKRADAQWAAFRQARADIARLLAVLDQD